MNAHRPQDRTTSVPWRLLAGLLLASLVLGMASYVEYSRFSPFYYLFVACDILYTLLLTFLCFQGSPRLLRAPRVPASGKQRGRQFIPALLSMGILFYLLGLLIWVYTAIHARQEPAYPSLAHLAYFGAYPFLIAAFLLLPSQNLSRLSRLRILFDSLMIMITVTTLYCYAVLIPILVTTEGTLLEKSIGSLFTAVDLVALFCLLLVALRTGEAVLQRVILLLGLAILIIFVGHVVSLAVLLSAQASLALRPNPAVLISLALISVAAQTMSRVLRTGESVDQRSTVLLEDTGMSARWKAVLMAAPVLIFALLVLSLLRHTESEIFTAKFIVVDLGSTLVLILLILRQLLAMHEVNSLKKELRTKNVQLEKLATSDPLTGVLNHRTLVEKLNEELAHAQEKQTPCSVLFMDLDHFKAINDQHGHLVGDLVLCQFAGAVASVLCPHDYLGRWGGEEFVAVILEKDLNEAYQVAEEVRMQVTRQVIGSQEKLHVTCSVGVATYPQTATEGERLISCADQALYVAKRLGRNQVRTAHEPEVLSQP